MSHLRIANVVASTRPARKGEPVGRWVLDLVWAEWNDKAAGFASYGSDGGIRAVEQLRPVMATLKIADVRAHVSLRLVEDFGEAGVAPRDHQAEALTGLLDEVVAWADALRTLRTSTGSGQTS